MSVLKNRFLVFWKKPLKSVWTQNGRGLRQMDVHSGELTASDGEGLLLNVDVPTSTIKNE